MRIKDRAKPKLPPVPAGTYVAVCVYSIDLGEQLGKDRNGKEYYANKLQLGFELCGETVERDGKTEPRVLGRCFPVSQAKNSALRKFIEGWYGRKFTDEEFGAFDTNGAVGLPAMINVVHNETGEYANIESIMPLPRGMAAPAAASPLLRFDLEPWDGAAFDALPDWAQEKIRKSTQYQTEHAPTDAVDFPDAPQQAAAAAPQYAAPQQAAAAAPQYAAPSGPFPAASPAVPAAPQYAPPQQTAATAPQYAPPQQAAAAAPQYAAPQQAAAAAPQYAAPATPPAPASPLAAGSGPHPDGPDDLSGGVPF